MYVYHIRPEGKQFKNITYPPKDSGSPNTDAKRRKTATFSVAVILIPSLLKKTGLKVFKAWFLFLPLRKKIMWGENVLLQSKTREVLV